MLELFSSRRWIVCSICWRPGPRSTHLRILASSRLSTWPQVAAVPACFSGSCRPARTLTSRMCLEKLQSTRQQKLEAWNALACLWPVMPRLIYVIRMGKQLKILLGHMDFQNVPSFLQQLNVCRQTKVNRPAGVLVFQRSDRSGALEVHKI